MYEHSSRWIGGQDVSASTLENAMLQLGGGIGGRNINSGVYNLKEHQKMASAGLWDIKRPTYDRESRPVQIGSQPGTISPILRSGRLILNNIFCNFCTSHF